jgi:hypothetical protein
MEKEMEKWVFSLLFNGFVLVFVAVVGALVGKDQVIWCGKICEWLMKGKAMFLVY